jgi:hypothetical protein
MFIVMLLSTKAMFHMVLLQHKLQPQEIKNK